MKIMLQATSAAQLLDLRDKAEKAGLPVHLESVAEKEGTAPFLLATGPGGFSRTQERYGPHFSAIKAALSDLEMSLFSKDRELKTPFPTLALGVWNKYRHTQAFNKVSQKFGGGFNEVVLGLEDGPHGLEVVKAKVSDTKEKNKPYKMSASLARFDFSKRVIGHWERIAVDADSVHPDEREFITYKEQDAQTVLYSKSLWCKNRVRKLRAAALDYIGFKQLMQAVQKEAEAARNPAPL